MLFEEFAKRAEDIQAEMMQCRATYSKLEGHLMECLHMQKMFADKQAELNKSQDDENGETDNESTE